MLTEGLQLRSIFQISELLSFAAYVLFAGYPKNILREANTSQGTRVTRPWAPICHTIPQHDPMIAAENIPMPNFDPKRFKCEWPVTCTQSLLITGTGTNKMA